MRRRMFLILALVIFVVAGVIYIVFQSGGGMGLGTEPTPTPEVSTYNIIFVAQDIPAGSTITTDSIIEGPWPEAYQLPGLITDKAAVVGKRARIDLRRGEPIFTSQVVETGAMVSDEGSLTALKIKTGKVGIAVPMDRLSGVAYSIGSGDHIAIIASMMFLNLDAGFQTDVPNKVVLIYVDPEGKLAYLEVLGGRSFKESPLSDRNGMLGTYYIPIEEQRPRMASAVLVQDARVLNVGTYGQGAPLSTAPTVEGQPATTPTVVATKPDILVIEVTPEEALAINFLIRLHADLTYMLRATGDSSTISVPSMDIKRLMDDFKIDLPPNLAYGVNPRIDAPYIPVLGGDVVVEPR
jgi:Flp pilus assembly protein CpaB